jgi:uncharacterized protein (DUF4415 family)
MTKQRVAPHLGSGGGDGQVQRTIAHVEIDCAYNRIMKRENAFRKGKRGRIVVPEPEQRGKTRITIRLDEDLVDYFLKG